MTKVATIWLVIWFARPALALPPGACGNGILSPAQLLVKLAERGLETGVLNIDDIRHAFTGSQLFSPLSVAPGTSENLSLKTGFAQALARVQPGHEGTVREAFAPWLAEREGQAAMALEARAKTRPLIGPHFLVFNEPKVKRDFSFWHHDAKGRLQVLSVALQKNEILEAETSGADRKERQIPLAIEPTRPLANAADGLSLADGEFLLALREEPPSEAPTAKISWWKNLGWRRTPPPPAPKPAVFVYRHSTETLTTLVPDARVSSLQLARANGEDFVLAVTADGLEIFDLGPNAPGARRQIPGHFRHAKLERSAIDAGQLVFAAIAPDGENPALVVYKPLESDQPIASWPLKWDPDSLSIHIRPNGDPVLALKAQEAAGVSIYEVHNARVRQMDANGISTESLKWHEGSNGVLYVYYQYHLSGSFPGGLFIYRPLEGQDDKVKPYHVFPCSMDHVFLVREPVGGADDIVFRFAQSRKPFDNLPSITKVVRLADLTEAPTHGVLPDKIIEVMAVNGDLWYLNMPEYGKSLSVGNLLTGEVYWTGPMPGWKVLPTATNEEDMPFIPFASEGRGLTLLSLLTTAETDGSR